MRIKFTNVMPALYVDGVESWVFEELRNITEEEKLLLDGRSSVDTERVCQIDVGQRSSERTESKRKYKTVKIDDCQYESCAEMDMFKSELRKMKEEVALLGKSLDDEKNKRMKTKEELKEIKEKMKNWLLLYTVPESDIGKNEKCEKVKIETKVVSRKFEYDIDRCDVLLQLNEQMASVVKTFFKIVEDDNEAAWISNTDMGLMNITKVMLGELLFDRFVYGQIIDWFWERKVRFMDASKSSVYVNTTMTKSGTSRLKRAKECLLITYMRKALTNNMCCNILFPLHESYHWSLLEVDLENSKWTLYDSLQPRHTTRTSLHMTSSMKIKSVVEEEVTKLKEEGFHAKLDKKKVILAGKCVQQSNGVDCGVFVMIAVERRVKGYDLADAVSEDLVKETRGKLAYEILSDKPNCWTVGNFYSSRQEKN